MTTAKAMVLTGFGPPDALAPGEVTVEEPGPGAVRVEVRYAGVGPTDLALRAGRLGGAFGVGPGSVLGFEASGVVQAVGPGVDDVAAGDRVAVFLPELGGYAEQVLARYRTRVPDGVADDDAAALPASGEAAARVVDEVGLVAGGTVLVIGAAGSVGLIAVQLAVALGTRVVAAVRASDAATVEALGAAPVVLGPDLVRDVRALVPSVDAVIDASGAGVLAAAVELAGGPTRVVTLSDPHAGDHGVRLSGPEGPRIGERLDRVMGLLASGRLALRDRTVAPLRDAAQIHRRLETGELRSKVLLSAQDGSTKENH